jgi:hypothetical protein
VAAAGNGLNGLNGLNGPRGGLATLTLAENARRRRLLLEQGGADRLEVGVDQLLVAQAHLVAARMMGEFGADLLLHSFLVDAIVDGDRLRGLIVASKSGRRRSRWAPARRSTRCRWQSCSTFHSPAPAAGGPAGRLPVTEKR